MMRSYARAWTTRVTMLLFAALLTAAQGAVFLSPVAHSDPGALGNAEAAHPTVRSAFQPIYGPSAARFRLIEYADLECPYCASSFEDIRRWIDAHTDVSWHWRHLPLSVHEPVATQASRRVQCLGELEGNEAFWKAIAQHYGHVRPAFSAAARSGEDPKELRECLQSLRPDAAIRADADEAARLHIIATPTFVLQDQRTGEHITLQGAPDESLLLSAVDALIAASKSE
jgi:protein-disulfide isomerase